MSGGKRGCCGKRAKAVEAPLYDDVNCPYSIKPSELFAMNEVRGVRGPQLGLQVMQELLSGWCSS
jgi:hypothetical protein